MDIKDFPAGTVRFDPTAFIIVQPPEDDKITMPLITNTKDRDGIVVVPRVEQRKQLQQGDVPTFRSVPSDELPMYYIPMDANASQWAILDLTGPKLKIILKDHANKAWDLHIRPSLDGGRPVVDKNGFVTNPILPLPASAPPIVVNAAATAYANKATPTIAIRSEDRDLRPSPSQSASFYGRARSSSMQLFRPITPVSPTSATGTSPSSSSSPPPRSSHSRHVRASSLTLASSVSSGHQLPPPPGDASHSNHQVRQKARRWAKSLRDAWAD